MISISGYEIGSDFAQKVEWRVREIVKARPSKLPVFEERFAVSNLTSLILNDFLRRNELFAIHPVQGLLKVSPDVTEAISGATELGDSVTRNVGFHWRSLRVWSNPEIRSLRDHSTLKLRMSQVQVRFEFFQNPRTTAPRILSMLDFISSCFLTFRTSELPERLEDISSIFFLLEKGRPLVTGDQANDEEVIAAILQLFEEGSSLTRDEFKSLVAPRMKIEAWRLIWKEAAERQPDLSKPGPRKSRSNSKRDRNT